MSSSLGDVLFTKTQQRELGLLFSNPEQTFYLNEVVRLAGVGKGSVNRELDKMLAVGLLSKTRIGNQNHFQANKQCPIYDELSGIVRKTFGIVDIIHQALYSLEDKIDVAFVYGSIAKGEDNAKSDIDLMVVSELLSYSDVMNELISVEQSLGRPVNPSIYTEKQIKDKLKAKNSFISRVMKQDKLWIKGSQDDIKGIR